MFTHSRFETSKMDFKKSLNIALREEENRTQANDMGQAPGASQEAGVEDSRPPPYSCSFDQGGHCEKAVGTLTLPKALVG